MDLAEANRQVDSRVEIRRVDMVALRPCLPAEQAPAVGNLRNGDSLRRLTLRSATALGRSAAKATKPLFATIRSVRHQIVTGLSPE
jgi:hypothetical protein